MTVQKIKYLQTICDQNSRLESLIDGRRIPNKTMARVNHSLSMIAHLLDELEQPHYNSAYMERQLADLVQRVNIIEEELLCCK
jgi:hypothetical protein